MVKNILILGGTTEARLLAGRLAGREDLSVMLSLAGRTVNPADQPVPVRSGGFGGVEGLAGYLAKEDIELLVDATHPYAARISANAAAAAALSKVEIVALRRPPWDHVDGDQWTQVVGGAEAVAALGPTPRRVFLALGRQEIGPFEGAPQHAYVIRSVDPIEPPPAMLRATYILARGPFAQADEKALLVDHQIDVVVAKNSGGPATYGKIAAARELGIEVILFRRPILAQAGAVETVDDAVAAVDHWLAGTSDRGV